MIKRHGFKYHCYEDDAEVCKTFKRLDNMDETSCYQNIYENKLLKLTQSKTELIVFSPKKSFAKTGNLRLKVRFSYIETAKSVKNLGIILDTMYS